MTWAVFIFLFALYPSQSLAAVQFNGETLNYSASDGLSQTSTKLAVRNEIEKPFFKNYGTQAEWHTGDLEWVRYSGVKGYGFLGAKLSAHAHAEMSLGAHRLENRFSDSEVPVWEAIPFWSAAVYFTPREEWTIEVKSTRDFLYQEWIDASLASEFLVSNQWSFLTEAYFLPHVRGKLEMQTHFLRDENQLSSFDSALQYQIFHEGLSLWSGVGGNLTAYKDAREEYWSPKRTHSVGVRTDASVEIFRKLFCELQLQVGRGKEIGKNPGIDLYSELRLSYAIKENSSLGIIFNHMDSFREEGDWNRNDIGLHLNLPL